MRKSRNIAIAAVVVAGLFAGCGSSGNHTAAWTKADVSELEGEISRAGGVVGQLRPCIASYLEQHASPSEARSMGRSSGEAILKSAVAACEKHAATGSYDHTSEWTIANKQELDNVLTALMVTNASCYEPIIERQVSPLGSATDVQDKVRSAVTAAAASCKAGEERESNESLEEQYRLEHGEATTGTTGTTGAGEATTGAGEATSSVGEAE